MRHREHPGGLYQIEVTRTGKAQQSVVPLSDVMIGPEERGFGLRRGPRAAIDTAERRDLLKIVSVVGARQDGRTTRPELRGSLERQRANARDAQTDRRR